MASFQSVAVWCASKPGAAQSSMDTHVNYWRIAGDEDFRRAASGDVSDFLEIGVMLDDPRQVERVCIYVPQEVDSSAVRDCSAYFAKPGIAQGIFNEVLTVVAGSRPGPRFVELRKNGTVFCRVCRFMTDGDVIDASDLEVARFAYGTLLTITRQAIEEECPANESAARAYFRLRVHLNASLDSPFIRTVPTPDKLLQSGFDEIEYIDFRLNEARTLPEQVESRMRNDQAGPNVQLRRVAFLTAVPVRSELSVSNTQFHKLRLLEHQLWNSYVPCGIPQGMMVYHWKREEPAGLTDFSAFVKLQTRRSGRWTLIRYLVVAFLFGVLGNLVASGVEPALSSMWQALQRPSESGSTPAPASSTRGQRQ